MIRERLGLLKDLVATIILYPHYTLPIEIAVVSCHVASPANLALSPSFHTLQQLTETKQENSIFSPVYPGMHVTSLSLLSLLCGFSGCMPLRTGIHSHRQ